MSVSFRRPLLASSAALAMVVAAQAAQAAPPIAWTYLGPFNSSGVPIDKLDMTALLPANLLAEIYERLPESRDIRKTDPTLITDDLGANITLVEDAEISVAYIWEGAGYRNALGFFTFDPANVPQTGDTVAPTIMFPRFTDPQLKAGDGVRLGKFKAGTAVGFSIVADGWNGTAVKPNQPQEMIYHTLKGLNPEAPGADNLNAHTVLLSKPEDELLILGFEDLNRKWSGCDHDFNDALIAIKVTPFSAIDRTQVQSLSTEVQDTDGDGIPDDLDAFPLDPDRAARRFYPSATGWGYLAFEDNWPAKGDFDMNDVVIAYRIIETLNAGNEITDVKLVYDVKARGGTARTGFGVHLPGIKPDMIDTAATTLVVNDGAPQKLPTETGQREAVFVLEASLLDRTATGERFPCSFFNTVSTCKPKPSVPLVAEIHFKQPVSTTQLGAAPYNPFIWRSSRGREIHLVDHPPTDKADRKLFNTSDDASKLAEGRAYRTVNGLPWALDLPETWQHPAEWNDIAEAYPHFQGWAESGGQQGQDWYIDKGDEALLYRP